MNQNLGVGQRLVIWLGGQANGQADVVIPSGLFELNGRSRIQIGVNSWTVWN